MQLKTNFIQPFNHIFKMQVIIVLTWRFNKFESTIKFNRITLNVVNRFKFNLFLLFQSL